MPLGALMRGCFSETTGSSSRRTTSSKMSLGLPRASASEQKDLKACSTLEILMCRLMWQMWITTCSNWLLEAMTRLFSSQLM